LANPFDLIKTRFQAVLPHEPRPYRNTYDAVKTIYHQNGFGGLYKGWTVTSGRAAVLTSAQLGSYDSIKHNLCMKVLNIKEGFGLHLAVSLIAGVITTTASNPREFCSPPLTPPFTSSSSSPPTSSPHRRLSMISGRDQDALPQ
jgi:hypothetical protein